MSLYGRVNQVYRRLPEPARRWAVERSPAPVRQLRERVVSRLERGAHADEIYDERYYDEVVDPLMAVSADAIAGSIQREFGAASAIDVGCGSGALMLALGRRGIGCVGFDRSRASLERCSARGLTVRRLDIRRDPFPSERADVVVSTEVAEHLPEAAADRFVDLLTSLAPRALVTAALPGSGGKDHVNEQPNEYWVAKFADRGWRYEEEKALQLREEWRAAGVDEAFFKSLMIFRG